MNKTLSKNIFKLPRPVDPSYLVTDEIEDLDLDSYIPFCSDFMSWDQIIFDGSNDITGYNIWYYDNTVYHSDGQNHHKLIGTTWVPINWIGLSEFSGSNVWTDGENIYYSEGESQYKLIYTTWDPIVWNGLNNFDGRYVWSVNNNIYYSHGSDQYKLDGDTWNKIEWGEFIPNFGDCIWGDLSNVYYSNGSDQYKLNGDTWDPIEWEGLDNIVGNSGIWTDGTDFYYSYSTFQYKLNKVLNFWEPIEWDGFDDFYGLYTWSDGINMFHSYGSESYKLLTIKKKRTQIRSLRSDMFNLVRQYPTSGNANYEGLFSYGANNNDETNLIRKASNFKFNPSTGNLQITQINGVTVGSSPKFTDTTDVVVQSFASAAVSVAADAATSISITGISKSGYTPLLAIYRLNSESNKYIVPTIVCSAVNSSGTATFAVRSFYSSARTVTISAYVIFRKT